LTRELANPAQVVSEAVNSLHGQASAKGVALVAELDPSLSPATLDAARIHQLLMNLISNAIKFTPEHGKITVRARRTGAELRIEVSDTGIGIPSDKLEAIFDRFVQIKKRTINAVWGSASTSRGASCKAMGAASGRRANPVKAAPSASRFLRSSRGPQERFTARR
jgi:K+-sensing histidine kinase KdpD